MRLAYFSPLNPQRSGISDYSEELLPHLAAGADITLFVDGFRPSSEELLARFRWHDYRRDASVLQTLGAYDAVVYHMGNDHRYHSGILEAMRAHPGIVVFHDFALQDFFLGLARARKDPRVYVEEVWACHGEAARREAAEALARGGTPSMVARPLDFPVNRRLAAAAEAVIVHSEWSRERFAEIAPGVLVGHISMPVKPPTFDASAELPKRGRGGTVRVANFGLITPGKGIEQALRALSALRQTHDFRYTLVGEPNSFFDVRSLVRRYGMEDRVEVTGHLPLEEFVRRIRETDIALNMRERTVGETSASLCRIMAAGVASVVSNVGWYAELPGDCVVKIDADECADALLYEYLKRLLEDPGLRARIGENARRHALEAHSVERSAAAYLDFINRVVARRPRRRLVGGVTAELSRLGIGPGDEHLLRSVADELAALAPAKLFEGASAAAPHGNGHAPNPTRKGAAADGEPPAERRKDADEQVTGAAARLKEAAERSAQADERREGAAERAGGPDERAGEAAERLKVPAERVIGAAEQLIEPDERVKVPDERLKGLAEHVRGAAEQGEDAAERSKGAAERVREADARVTGAAAHVEGAGERLEGAGEHGEGVAGGRLRKIEGVDYKRAAVEYLGLLGEERQHHLRTKPFYNLAHKLPKYKGEGLDEDSHRHFCDFANMALVLALPPGSRILDVGCGSGWLSEYFARLGYVVKGLDISPSLVEMSRERVARVPYGVDHETPLRCTFEVHDIEGAPLPEKFDAAICYDSLHHFEDERAVIRNISEMLEPGGLLFILEGERPPEGSASEEELRGVMLEYRTLESPFSYDYLRGLLAEQGFAVVGDYVSINGLFEREMLEGNRLPLDTLATNYHYLTCKKVADGSPASRVPDSRDPRLLRALFTLRRPAPESVEPGATLSLSLSVENTGDTLWLTAQTVRAGIVMPALRVYEDATGDLVREIHGEPMLPRAVAPGESVNFKIEYTVPRHRGAYTLKIDLVNQHVCWFEDRGSAPLVLRFEVV
jgi:glycosyltransferase involved in cell wall biosynthesis/SAM-dependent methyltransferase